MVRITRVVTGGGDKGQTSLGSGERVAKDDLRIYAIGDTDELNAQLGVLRLHLTELTDFDAMVRLLQNDLFDVGADLCVPGPAGDHLRMTQAPIDRLLATIEQLNAALPPLTSFVLPEGAPASVYAHVARTVARRAERQVVALGRREDINPHIGVFLNRVSDFLFVLARTLNHDHTVLWVPGASQT